MHEKGALDRVIDGGYCIGCGGCAALDPGISITLDNMQRLQAVLPNDRAPTLTAVAACPFADGNPDEDTLAAALFDATDIQEDARIGRHLATFGGWVEEEAQRERASSGGIGTWLQVELLDKGLVDAVLNVQQVDVEAGGAPLFRFAVARDRNTVMANAKTRYYPVEMSDVIRYILDKPGRYAVIGVPCFAKALRLAARAEPVLAQRLAYVLGIVCGHLKSAAFAKTIAWQCGIDPDGVETIDFRAKLEGRSASRYGVSIKGRRIEDAQIESLTRPMEGLIGANWGHGLFKYKACEFCDDVLAETADVVVGDAWLPAYEGDHRGANIVVVRHPMLLDMLTQARDEGRLHLDDLSADDVAASQAGGLRHRRDGLAYRLWLTDRAGVWRPKKRVAPARQHLAPAMRRIHAARYALGQASHEAWRAAHEADEFTAFDRRMTPMIATYDRLMKPGLAQRALGLVERNVDALLFRLGLRK